MINSWSNSSSIQMTNYVSSSGLPDKDYLWKKDFKEEPALFDALASTEKCIAYYHYIDGKEKELIHIDPNTGNETGDRIKPINAIFGNQIILNDEYVLVDRELFMADGCYLNIDDLLTDNFLFEDAIKFEEGNNLLFRLINPDINLFEYFLLDTDTLISSVLKLPLIGCQIDKDTNNLYGWIQNGDDYHLASCNLDGEIIWQAPSVNIGIIRVGEQILIITQDSGYLIDKKTGEIINCIDAHITRPETINSHSFNSTSAICYCGDTFAINSDDKLFLYSIVDNKLLNTVDKYEVKKICAGGDLIFATVSSGHLTDKLVCFDRYTGEEVWSCDNEQKWQAIICSNNKLIAVTLRGSVYCFDCSTSYHSSY